MLPLNFLTFFFLSVLITHSCFKTDQIYQSRVERVKSNNESKKIRPRDTFTEQIPEKSINYSEFCEDVQNFCKATVDRMGTIANDYLKKIVYSLSNITTLNQDIIALFMDTDFFRCSSECINTNHPTLLLNITRIYCILAYYSTPFVSEILENGILTDLGKIFINSSYSMDMFKALIGLFCNTCSDSPEARVQAFDMGIFDKLCDLVMSTDDGHIILLVVRCINSFFPDAQLVNEERVQTAMLEPMKSLLIRFVSPENDDEDAGKVDPHIKDSILNYVFRILLKFCISENNIVLTYNSGLVQLMIDIMGEVGQPNLIALLETISVILSLNNPEINEAIENSIDLNIICSTSNRFSCDILTSLFIFSNRLVEQAIELHCIDMAANILENGLLDEKISAAVMLSALILDSSVSTIEEHLLNEDIIDELLLIWKNKTLSKKDYLPIHSALRAIYLNFEYNEEIKQLFDAYDFENEEEIEAEN